MGIFGCFTDAKKDSNNSLELRHQPSALKQSTSQERTEPAICVTNAYKHYGFGYNPVVVLNGLNLIVQKGTIYALLGASGCGKTTLLNCILGQRKLNSGKIWTLGQPPGTKGSAVPGPRVGYMPQETALYGEFTIYETLIYFGWIAGMDKKQIIEKFETLTKLFMLPDTNQPVKSLSGGEQRRVSLISAILHEPELLLLDEPTVGTDPLLRECIWSHLLDICKNKNTTILITTHYIEEARQAHMVGLLRGGTLLATAPPENLLTQYKSQTLEDVFLKLSIAQDSKDQRSHKSTTSAIAENTNDCIEDIFISSNEKVPVKISDYLLSIKGNHIKALVWKNLLWWMRNLPTLVFVLVLGAFLMSITCLCIGHDLTNLPIAVVNYETNNTVNCNSTLTCDSIKLSCSYLEYLKRHSMIPIYYSSEDNAEQSVTTGKTYASLIVRQNYSSALRARIDDWINSEPWNVESSSITVFRDVSDTSVATYMKLHMYDAFQTFMEDYLDTCNVNAKVLNIPIKWESIVYGVKYPNYTDFVAPGVLLTMCFMIAIILTSYVMLTERHEASLERTFIMGITETELLLSHIISEFGIVVLQSLFPVITTFFIFEVTHKGSITLIAFLTILAGVCGMNYGILISCLCDNFITVNLLAIGTFFPILFLSGVSWPIEGIHHYIKPFLAFLPLTLPIESLRSILQRSWDLSESVVYTGFICISVWSIMLLILSIIVLKYKKN